MITDQMDEVIDSLQDSRATIRRALERLAVDAYDIAYKFYGESDMLRAQIRSGGQTDSKAKARKPLIASVSLNKEYNSLSISWFQSKGWIGEFGVKHGDNRRRSLNERIKAPKLRNYQLDVLRKRAPDWQQRLVVETEKKLAELRGQAFLLGQLSHQLAMCRENAARVKKRELKILTGAAESARKVSERGYSNA